MYWSESSCSLSKGQNAERAQHKECATYVIFLPAAAERDEGIVQRKIDTTMFRRT